MGPFDVERDFEAPAEELRSRGERGGLAILIDPGETRRIGQTGRLIEDMRCAAIQAGVGRFHEAGVVVRIEQPDRVAGAVALDPGHADLVEAVGRLRLLRRLDAADAIIVGSFARGGLAHECH
jgi:hypothetical protein